ALLADINAQHPDTDVAEIEKLIADNYKAPDAKPDAAAWKELLKKVDEKYPPKGYVVGRGRLPELAKEAQQQNPDKSANEIADFLKRDSGAAEKTRRGVSLTPEQVQEKKDLIASQGSLEFRIMANGTNDREAIDAARAFFDKADKDPGVRQELE